MTSFSQTRIGKENSNDLLLSSTKNQLANSFKLKCNVNSTPVNSKIAKLDLGSTVRRKALGEICNTAKGTTTKRLVFHNVASTTTPIKTNAKVLNLLKSSSISSSRTSKNKFAYEENVEPPVERFIAPPLDTFADLFEHGKISDMMLGKKLPYMPKLSTGNSAYVDSFNLFTDLNEVEWSLQINKWESLNIGEEADQLQYKEMPDSLDHLAFKMPDNF
jgi:hypothetical protein